MTKKTAIHYPGPEGKETKMNQTEGKYKRLTWSERFTEILTYERHKEFILRRIVEITIKENHDR